MKLAPEDASILLIVSLISTFLLITFSFLVVGGYVPMINQEKPNNGYIHTSTSDTGEVEFEVVDIGNIDQYEIETPNGKTSYLKSTGDKIAYSEDGVYKVYVHQNGYKELQQTVNPNSTDIDPSQYEYENEGKFI